MNLHELKATLDSLRRQLSFYELIKPSCSNCNHLQGSLCAKFAAQPPQEWLTGPVECEHWDYDNIPF